MARSALSVSLLIGLFAMGLSTPARKGKKQNAPTGAENSSGPVTCPGYAGYCSESYPGDTCLVVCARGRNNVPECQDDGTWTDVPRCIEHEPGKEEQVPGVCPGIPGYCSLDLPGGLCTFECPVGPPIRSTCTLDGTWDPYPTCNGDPRETQDGCNPCPGPLGAPRNRTAEGGSPAGGRKSSGGAAAGGSSNKIAGGGGVAGATSGNSGNRNAAAASGQKAVAHEAAAAAPPKANNRPAASTNKNTGGAAAAAAQHSNNSGARPASGANAVSGGGGCPGEVLQACIDVCPGISTRVYGACVAGCAKRCPDRK